MKEKTVEVLLKSTIVCECGTIGFKLYQILKNTAMFNNTLVPAWFWSLIILSIFTEPLTKGFWKVKNIKASDSKNLQTMIQEFYDD